MDKDNITANPSKFYPILMTKNHTDMGGKSVRVKDKIILNKNEVDLLGL